jgi:hypothetical protein
MKQSTRRQPTGSEQLQHRVNLATFLTGAAVMIWLIPITLYFSDHVPHGLFTMFIGIAGPVSTGCFLLGLVFRSQWRAERRHELAEARARQDREQMTQLISDNHAQVLAQFEQLSAQVNRVSVSVMQEYFNSYSDAATDLIGGQAVVDGTSTRAINDARVVRLPRHSSTNTGRR